MYLKLNFDNEHFGEFEFGIEVDVANKTLAIAFYVTYPKLKNQVKAEIVQNQMLDYFITGLYFQAETTYSEQDTVQDLYGCVLVKKDDENQKRMAEELKDLMPKIEKLVCKRDTITNASTMTILKAVYEMGDQLDEETK